MVRRRYAFSGRDGTVAKQVLDVAQTGMILDQGVAQL